MRNTKTDGHGIGSLTYITRMNLRSVELTKFLTGRNSIILSRERIIMQYSGTLKYTFMVGLERVNEDGGFTKKKKNSHDTE